MREGWYDGGEDPGWMWGGRCDEVVERQLAAHLHHPLLPTLLRCVGVARP